MKRCILRGGMAIAVVACALTLRASDESNTDVHIDESATVSPASDGALPEATPAVPRRLPSVLGGPPDVPLQPSYPKSPVPSAAQPGATVPPAAAGVLAYYQNAEAASILNQVPVRPATNRPPQRLVYAPNKPFNDIQREPTVSPYLNLFRDDDDRDDQVPNYFTLVRPQLEQQQKNRAQNRELQRLGRTIRTLEYQQQLNTSTATGVPSTGHRTRFFDTTGYYATPSQRR